MPSDPSGSQDLERSIVRQVAGADLDLDVAIVLGKGRRERALPYGRKTAVALDRSTVRRAATARSDCPRDR
jgi:site-specific recombinase XerC